jgi:putative transposase
MSQRSSGRPLVSEEVRGAVVNRLQTLREGKSLSSAHVRLVAESLQVSPRTVWRWLQQAGLESRTHRREDGRFKLGEEDISDLAYHLGNFSAMHRARAEAGIPMPSLSTLHRAVARQLTAGRREGLALGERARRERDTYLTRTPEHRNQWWEADHTQLALEVLLPDRRVVKPWATLFLDAFSRAIPGYAIAVTPSRESVLAALRSAILVEDPYGPFGGVPAVIRFDRGREFMAEAIGAAAGALAIEARPLAAYSPHLKGAVERVNETIEQLLLVELPGFVHGPRRRDGHLVDETAPLLTLGHFVQMFDNFVRHYNTQRPHRGLGGDTPLARWQADATPLQVVPGSKLRHLILVETSRVITKRGVSLHARTYNCSELCGRVGDRVEVRYMPHHDHWVEIFSMGQWLATAYLVGEMDPAESRRLLEYRAEEAKWLARQQAAAAKRRRMTYAALTQPGVVEEATALTSESTGMETVRYGDRQRAAAASRSLTGHKEVPSHMVRPPDRAKRRAYVDPGTTGPEGQC